jgi:methylmalonyl-CoA/ethylmalonyl-CoA epimerase
MKIDHICFAVKNINDAISYWEEVFNYTQMTRIIINSRQKVKVTFLRKNHDLTIKLIEPLPENHSLMNFVSTGGGFHHICYKCSNLDKKIIELEKKGLIMLVPPEPGEAFNNHKIAFLHSRYGLNIELIDTNEKTGRL